MFKQYANNYVDNHSVGMRYVKIFLAVNDPEYLDEFEVWSRYINSIVNAELANEKGYFYAVTEAKVIEGSAVPIGSNHVTPTRSVTPKIEEIEIKLSEQEQEINTLKEILSKIEPQIEPDKSTLINDSTQDIELLKFLSNKLNK